MNTAFEVSIIIGNVLFVILTSACIVVFIDGTVHAYEPVFVVDAMMVFHAVPLFVEYSILTADAKAVASHVIVCEFCDRHTSPPFGVIIKFPGI